jgi:bifunctional UDP-N-acetylglucosamine pyrophosphorylase/glucosamine-1-phosphate N-acetyltransferase
VLYGDTPFIRPETLDRLLQARARHSVVVLGFTARDPAYSNRFRRITTSRVPPFA